MEAHLPMTYRRMLFAWELARLVVLLLMMLMWPAATPLLLGVWVGATVASTLLGQSGSEA